jgi:mRNA-degrading endonuclease toxin of MazEF toxin-antitoxin module
MSSVLQGEVYYWSDLPPDHPMGQKQHMWVVISSSLFNELNKHVMACPLTSYAATPLDVPVARTPHNRLQHDSALRVSMMSPIPKARLEGPIARLPFEIVCEVTSRIEAIIRGR